MVPSTGTILQSNIKSNQEGVAHYPDIVVTLELVVMAYMDSQYCSSQRSYLDVINISFSPLPLWLKNYER